MEIRNVKREDLDAALAATNEEFGDNVIWNRSPEYLRNSRQGGEVYRLTLRVEDSRGPGAKIGHSGRRTVAACWHVHGTFMDAVFDLAPDAEIVSSGPGGKRKIHAGDPWMDWNIGSMWRPMQYSYACEC